MHRHYAARPQILTAGHSHYIFIGDLDEQAVFQRILCPYLLPRREKVRDFSTQAVKWIDVPSRRREVTSKGKADSLYSPADAVPLLRHTFTLPTT